MKSGIILLKQIRTGERDKIMFQILDEQHSIEKAIRFFGSKISKEKKYGKEFPVSAEFETFYERRTLSQNNLLRALERIMAFEQDETEDTYHEYHEGLIEKYCPDRGRENPITKRRQKKRTSELNTVEMAQVIGGAFFELSAMGIEVTSTNIGNYWVEWYNWRGKQSHDPFTDRARTIEQYRHDVPVCEACMKGLVTTDLYGKDIYAGQIAHIVSRGAGGTDDIWNLMHLCTDCHINLQHQNGWIRLISKHKHIAWRIATAQIKAGCVVSIQDLPEWAPVMKEINRIQKISGDEKTELVKEIFNGEEIEREKNVQQEELEIW